MPKIKKGTYELVFLQGGIETAGFYSGTYEEMRFWLDAKEKSHKVHGYKVKREGNTLYAWKKAAPYPGGIKRRKIFIRKRKA